jgi:hypothetical protein
MASNRVELKLTGFKQFGAALDHKRFQANLEANIGKATVMNGMMVASEIRKRIKGRRYAANAPLTVLIKKSSTPLVDDADLFGAVTSKNLGKYSVFVGILRSAVSDDGRSMVNLAELLHNGGMIPVTEAMRGMFIILYEVGQGKREASSLEGRTAVLAKALGSRIKHIRPLKPSTKYITIPPRPFITSVLRDPIVHKRCERNWNNAVRAAFKDQASGSSQKGGAPSGETRAATPPQNAPASARSRGKKPPKPRANRSEAARRGWETRRKKQQPK